MFISDECLPIQMDTADDENIRLKRQALTIKIMARRQSGLDNFQRWVYQHEKDLLDLYQKYIDPSLNISYRTFVNIAYRSTYTENNP